MTLVNCQRLLKHYNDLADGTIPKPFGHKDWQDVVYNAKLRAKEMEKRIAHKLGGGSELTRAVYGNIKQEEEPKKEVKKSGKRPA